MCLVISKVYCYLCVSQIQCKVMKNSSEHEIWRPVVGYEGLYEVSNLGRVRSMGHYVTQNGNCGTPFTRFYKGRIIHATCTSNGYEGLTLSNGSKRENKSVHRLVAEAFIPNPNGLPQVNHKNEVRNDNRAENLEWCTVAYNVTYGHRTEKAARARSKPVLQITRGGTVVASFLSIHSAAEETGIYYRNIYAVANRTKRFDKSKRGNTRKTAGGFVWVYLEDYTPNE